MKSVALLAPLLLTATPALAADPEAPIRAAVGLYVAGLKKADLASLNEAFAAEGQFIVAGKDGRFQSALFAKVLPTWVTKPDDQVALSITGIDMPTPGMAAVTAKLRTAPRCYDDQLLLLPSGEKWKIVAKTTVVAASCDGWPKP